MKPDQQLATCKQRRRRSTANTLFPKTASTELDKASTSLPQIDREVDVSEKNEYGRVN